jgi:RHS repeat-associated protein
VWSGRCGSCDGREGGNNEAHTYVETTTSNHAGAARRLTLPRDPDFGGGPGPLVVGEMGVNRMGLMENSQLIIGGAAPVAVLANASYDQYGSEELAIMGANLVYRQSQYDARRRPTLVGYSRAPTLGAPIGTLQSVQYPIWHYYGWDTASNLTTIYGPLYNTNRNAVGHQVQSMTISHDTLYRVSNVQFIYGLYPFVSDPTMDWRSDAQPSNTNDPMHPRPAPRVGALPTNRVTNLNYAYDWLGNQTDWHDDQSSFFERSIGEITNGREVGARPGALYLSTNIPGSGGIESTWGGAGWVEVNYGQGGNVSDYTVHGQCQDRVEPSSCSDVDDKLANRISNFQTNCTCATEQHFSLRWDELNRLVEGRRFDRVGGSVGSGTGAWTYAARMRYRYDGANQRTVKESFEATGINTASRVALFIYPGDFERRGLVRNTTTYDAVTTGVDATETQYMVAGARIVWDPATSATSPNFDRNRRITYALTDLLQTSSGVVDLVSGELLELSTYYPNGARENLWASDSNAPLEPMGFTGKEADEEIGLTYFGERWLMPRLGRWASPDPLHVHASGGGEALNSYHYVGGNLLQARDPLGLDATVSEHVDRAAQRTTRTIHIGILVAPGAPAQRPNSTDRIPDTLTQQQLKDAAVAIRGNLESRYQSFEIEEEGWTTEYRFEFDVIVTPDPRRVDTVVERPPSSEAVSDDPKTIRSAREVHIEALERGVENLALIVPELSRQAHATRLPRLLDRALVPPPEGVNRDTADVTVLAAGDLTDTTVSHEVGHLLGLRDWRTPGSLMGGQPEGGLTDDDRAHIHAAVNAHTPGLRFPTELQTSGSQTGERMDSEQASDGDEP